MIKKAFFTTLVCSLSFVVPCMAYQPQGDSESQLPQKYLTWVLETLPENPKIRSLAHELVTQWENHYEYENPHFDMERLVLAIIYGAQKHQGQIRKDAQATPYIIHPLQVCQNLWEIGKVRNVNILISAILHDTLEDTSATEDELYRYFGHRVCETVKEVTNDPNLSSDENKQRQIDHVFLMSQDARLVKLADRLANIVDLRSPPPAWSVEKIDGYFVWGEKLLAALKDTNSHLEVALQEEITNHQQVSDPMTAS